ncbi:metallophosphoesterase [Pedobacter faecalis]|uniref:metallophosphoesterase n=1 Tax=Pedobacter faecalis TaxID=3041495 RepID=UPI00255080DE|nr:metallophosphoesterase [Pedobacter sp. ELA7]
MKRRFNLFPLLFAALILFLVNWYVLSGLQTLIAAPYVAVLFSAFVLLITGMMVLAILRVGKHGMGWLFKISTHAFLILIAAELVFVMFLIPGDFYSWATHHPRNVYWTGFALFMFFVVVLLFLYGMLRGKYAYRVVKHTLYFDDLPSAFDGFTITQISDVHAGSFNSKKSVQKGIDLVKKQASDLFVFTGDLVNNKAEEIIPWMEHFSQIKAPYGQFSVLGNHDYGDYVKWPTPKHKHENLELLKSLHKGLGYRLLLDEHVVIHKGGQKIVLAGVENWGLGFGERGDLQRAMNGVNSSDFKILLSHDPTHWEAEVLKYPSRIQLTLSGHTHGMQFGIEAFGLRWSPVKYRYPHWAGIKTDQGRVLNINRGFGFIGFSGRVGIWPEITVLQLKKSV